MQTRQNKNYNLFTSLQTTFPKNDKQLISNELSPKKIIPFIIQNTDSQNLNVQNKQVLSWFVKKKAENKNKISNQPTPDFVIKNTFKSQCLEQKQSKNKIISNPAFDFLDAIQTVQEIDGNIFQQNNSQVHTSTECESQLNLVNKNYYKAEKKLIKKNKGFFINQHKNYEQPYKFNASVNNNFNLSIKEQQQLPINYRQDNPQRLELYPFIQKIDKNRIQSSLKAKQFEQKKKKQQSSQELIQISHTQKLKTFPSPKQVKRLLSSTQISKMHGHPLHMFKFHKSPLRLQFNLSPLTKKSTNLNIISHSQIKNKPQFLQKKSVSKVNQDCKYLPNNKIIILNVLSSKKQATAGLQILKLIADNNTSTIYLVRQIYTNCLYVLKKNQIKQITSLQFQFLIRQGKVGAKLDHPSLLKTYCTLYDKQNIYQLIQYMQGLTLYEKSPTQRSCLIKKYPPNKTKRITSQKDKYPLSSQQLKLLNIKYILNSLLEAVAHMHKQGVIHRDIKPSNIFISNDQTLKIGDFGSVGYMGSKQYVGTLDYVTPEVLTRQKYDYGVDIWSVGCIAYQLWTGLPPFYHQNREKTIDNIINQNFNRQRLTDLSLLNFIDKLLEKDPSKRITANQALIHHFLESYRRQIQ